MAVPLVSVIMPVYNAEKYLGQAIESILSQTLTDFEFLIFDDGSTDSSTEIIRHYAAADARIVAYYSEYNLGYVSHLNRGIHLAKGEYIARMDSDDISLANRLQQQLTFLLSNPNIAIVGCSSIRIDENNQELGVVERDTQPDELLWQSFFVNPLSHPTIMFRKEPILEVGGYRVEKQPSEDYDLWTRLLPKYDMANIVEPLLKYREHSASISVQKRSLQLTNSVATLIAHWYSCLCIQITPDVAIFLKGFHKGQELLSTENAFDIFNRIFTLNYYLKRRYGKLTDRTVTRFIAIQIYLVSQAREVSWLIAIAMLVRLLVAHPYKVAKRLL